MKILISYLDTFIDNINETVFVVLIDNNTVGIIHLNYKEKTAAYLRFLYIHKDWRRKGLASLLIKTCCKMALDAGCETIGLLIEKENDPALMLYKKLGFIFVYEYENGSKLMSKNLKSLEIIGEIKE